MRLLKRLSIFLQIIVIGLMFSGVAQAGQSPCSDLIRPLHNQVNGVKDRGGIWGQFEKAPGLQNHSALALRLDSKIIGLMYTLDYLCDTQEGVPYSDIAEYVVSNVKKKGREGFIQENVDLGHSLKEVTEWAEFAEFSQSNLNRKLDFKQIGKTVEGAGPHIERYALLFQNKNSPSAILAEAKALAGDIEQFRASDPYLKQADYENNQIPHSSALANSGDAM